MNYKFISRTKKERNISEEYIRDLENRLNIKFPKVLRDYYMNYNSSDITEFPFFASGLDFSVEFIIPLKYGTVSVEQVLEYNKKIEYIPSTFIPLAEEVDGDDFYWDCETGKVYYLAMCNVENPIPICDSVEEFFEILNNAYENRDNAYSNLKLTEVFLVWEKPFRRVVKYVAFAMLTIIFLLTVRYGDSLLGKYSLVLSAVTGLMTIFVLCSDGRVIKESPVELRLLKDRFEVLRTKTYSNSGKSRRELYSFKYQNSPTAVYKEGSGTLVISGVADTERFDYDEFGNLAPSPIRSREMNAVCGIRISDNSLLYLPPILKEHTKLNLKVLGKFGGERVEE